MSWTFTCALDGPGELHLENGRSITPDQLSTVVRPGMSKSTLDVFYGDNNITFTDKGASLEMVFNGATNHVGTGTVELHLSKMAACIGDACLMWPPPPPAKIVTAAMKPSFNLVASTNVWSFTFALDGPPLPLRINGNEVTPAEVAAMVKPGMSSGSLEMEYGPNIVTFSDKGASLEMVFNGTTNHTGKGAVELHLSKMAACIGDACLMWPPLPAKKETDAEFLNRMQAIVGAEDFAKLQEVLGSTMAAASPEATVEEGPHSAAVAGLHKPQEFEYLLDSNRGKLVVIDFWANWCVPCKRFTPTFNSHAEVPFALQPWFESESECPSPNFCWSPRGGAGCGLR